MKFLKKIVLLIFSLFSLHADALTVTGKIFVGPTFYLKNPNSTPTSEDKFAIDTAASRLYFSENVYGDVKNGVYFLNETDISSSNLSIKHLYLGYKQDVMDLRLGMLDSLVYSWVGSYSDPWNFGGNIAVIPQYNRYLTNSAKFIAKLSDQFQLGVDAGLAENTRDYTYIDLGGKWSNNKLTVAMVYQENNNDSSTAFENRNTWGSAIAYNINTNLTLKANYAHYTDTYSSNSHEDSFSIGGNTKYTYLTYQTSQNKDQARVNFMHSIPLTKSSSIGLEAQIPVNAKYYKNGATTQTYDTSFGTIYLGLKF